MWVGLRNQEFNYDGLTAYPSLIELSHVTTTVEIPAWGCQIHTGRNESLTHDTGSTPTVFGHSGNDNGQNLYKTLVIKG